MTFGVFLNALAACAGFLAAAFFAAGATLATSEKIFEVASTYWDVNLAWADSLAAQRADYVAGAFLLLVSFGVQITAVFVPSGTDYTFVRSVTCGVGWILGATATLLLGALALRILVVRRTKAKIRRLAEERARTQQEEIRRATADAASPQTPA